MDTEPAQKIEAASAGLRLVMASPEGITLDRSDIRAIRVGHTSGFSLFTASTEQGEWRFAGCGIEWLCFDGRIERQSVAEAMVEVLAPGLVAIACRSAGLPAEE
jgi:hypothetical protein